MSAQYATGRGCPNRHGLSGSRRYTDMAIGVPQQHEQLQAALAGLWNAAYAIVSLPAFATPPPKSESLTRPPSQGWALGPILGGMLMDADGFAGFATIMAIASATYSIVLLGAGCAWGGGKRDDREEGRALLGSPGSRGVVN